jgi:hypothetical protein
MKTKNESAVMLGKLSAKSRFKGMTKKQRSEAMRKVRNGGKTDERLTKV